MQIQVSRFAGDKPSARVIILGYSAFWFAGADMIAHKYMGYMFKHNVNTGYSGQVSRELPEANSSWDCTRGLNKFAPVYRMSASSEPPRINMFAGKSANAFALVFGDAAMYFSYDTLVGIQVYDKRYMLQSSIVPSATMRKHINMLITPSAACEIVSAEALNALVDRYFYQFVKQLSCL